ncbi:site-specific integrase [Synechococcus sp. CBW1108]|uniref:site-specific integrase n=1 Tax=Synechococcus sp. CBW1108 TaxID=1353147 RepID=UPI0018CDBCB1|nr:site-specific integrase [Synechococcus sp. CBW1108]QPN70025.1 site-specific integrase [Synechococcus sp. CBW1108]
MPRVRNQEPWAIAFREHVRELCEGWTVRESPKSGRVMLKVRGEAEQAITLPFAWAKSESGDAYIRIRNVYALTQEGNTLRQAAEIAAGKAPKLTEQRDWPGALERFKAQKLEHGTAIKPGTWATKYQPVLTEAVELLTSRKPPTTPADLLDRCIRSWPPGSRTRQERARNLAQFMRYCVAREQVPVVWAPPTDLKEHIGRRPPTATSKASDPITDQQIIDLIASLPDDAAGQRWADVLRLLSELGLRPIELLHLSVKADPKTGERYWWCSYEKRAGGGITKPRRLFPLPLVDAEGAAQQWHLLERWPIELPSLRSGNGAADAIATYLNRRTGWKSLRAQLEAQSQRLSCYSFRHSYSVRGHQRGIDNGSMALAMGHSIEVHCRSYPWATEAGAAAAFERAAVP